MDGEKQGLARRRGKWADFHGGVALRNRYAATRCVATRWKLASFRSIVSESLTLPLHLPLHLRLLFISAPLFLLSSLISTAPSPPLFALPFVILAISLSSLPVTAAIPNHFYGSVHVFVISLLPLFYWVGNCNCGLFLENQRQFFHGTK